MGASALGSEGLDSVETVIFSVGGVVDTDGNRIDLAALDEDADFITYNSNKYRVKYLAPLDIDENVADWAFLTSEVDAHIKTS